MGYSHTALLLYTENGGLEENRFHDSELLTVIMEYLHYFKKLTAIMLIHQH